MERSIERFLFASRWLMAPFYIGLVGALAALMIKFIQELVYLVPVLLDMKDSQVILAVLTLVDLSLAGNLLLMVIVGGYETFVSRLYLEGNPDQPEWLAHVNAGTMKVKLSMSLIGISSIHLLKTFIEAPTLSQQTMMWQVIIHLTFVLSAMAMAFTNRLMDEKQPHK